MTGDISHYRVDAAAPALTPRESTVTTFQPHSTFKGTLAMSYGELRTRPAPDEWWQSPGMDDLVDRDSNNYITLSGECAVNIEWLVVWTRGTDEVDEGYGTRTHYADATWARNDGSYSGLARVGPLAIPTTNYASSMQPWGGFAAVTAHINDEGGTIDYQIFQGLQVDDSPVSWELTVKRLEPATLRSAPAT